MARGRRAAEQKVLQNRSVLCLFSIKKGISQAKVIFKIIKPSVNNIKTNAFKRFDRIAVAK